MINELEGKMTVELLKKYFWNHKKTNIEQQKELELHNMFKEFTKKVYGQEEEIFSYNEWFGYLEDYGYYILVDGDPGICLPYVNNYGFNKENAFFDIICYFLMRVGQRYEFKNRKELNKDFDNRFGEFNFKSLNGLDINRYFSCLYFAEYELDKWDKYYDGILPRAIIIHYENYLNDIWWTKEQGVIWKYDRKNKKFSCKRNIKVRKLEK